MSWTTVTTDDVKSILSAGEYTKYTTGDVAVGYTTLIADVIAQVTGMVRSYVAGCNQNELDTDTTKIPIECKYSALSIIAVRLQQRLGGKLTDLSEIRIKEYDNAIAFLTSVSKCDLEIAPPDVVSPVVDSTFKIYSGTDTKLIY